MPNAAGDDSGVTDVQLAISIISGVITVLGGLVSFIKWSDSASPNSNTRPGDPFVWDSFIWITIFLSLGVGVLAGVLAWGFSSSMPFAVTMGVIVAFAFWIFWWFKPVEK